MSDGFQGFPAAAFDWFAGLEADNSKAYFTATRARFQADVRDALEAMFDELSGRFGGQVRIFRQHRDLRFTPDKSPYKTRTYGLLYGLADTRAALYAELSGRGLYAGTGYHVLTRDQLERFRAAVADDRTGPRLAAAVATAVDAGLEIEGEQLRTAPRGHPRDHARIDLLRRKAVIAGRREPPGEDGIGRDAAIAHVAGSWRAAAPINAWLDEHVGPSTEERWSQRG
jgi:uncharacterized protein (TIGR02453 family)